MGTIKRMTAHIFPLVHSVKGVSLITEYSNGEITMEITTSTQPDREQKSLALKVVNAKLDGVPFTCIG